MEEPLISELQNEQKVTANFATDAIYEPRRYSSKSGMFFALKAHDKTGEILVKFWGKEAESKILDIYALLKEGDVVRIENGKVSTYKDKLEIHISEKDMGRISKSSKYDPERFLPITEKSIPGMISKFKDEIESISDYNIKRLLHEIFDDSFMEIYSKATAAKKHHHSYVGGLLEHVLSMVYIARVISEQYKPGLNLDLLIAGCMLHDIGKVEEYKISHVIDYSVQGSLIGHIAIGYRMVEYAINKLPGFPPELKIKILHMILSHHTMAYGSTVEPMFPEAVALHAIDSCDAQIKNVIQSKERLSGSDKEFVWDDGRRMYLK